MDHTVSPQLASLTEAFSSELLKLSPIERQHVLQDLLNQSDTRTVVVYLDDSMGDAESAALFRMIKAAKEWMRQGVSALAVIGQPDAGRRFVGVKSEDYENASFRESFVFNPTGCTYRSASIGPFDLHLPAWVDPVMGAEITGILWRVLRFILAGYESGDLCYNQAQREALKERAKYTPQYAAIGYLRWLLWMGSIPLFDYFGNKVEDEPEYFYGKLFEPPCSFPPELKEQAREIIKEPEFAYDAG